MAIKKKKKLSLTFLLDVGHSVRPVCRTEFQKTLLTPFFFLNLHVVFLLSFWKHNSPNVWKLLESTKVNFPVCNIFDYSDKISGSPLYYACKQRKNITANKVKGDVLHSFPLHLSIPNSSHGGAQLFACLSSSY